MRWSIVPLCLALSLTACDDKAAPTQTDADRILGDWYLAATEGGSDLSDLLSVSWRFTDSGEVRQRLGGPFLRQLRDLEVVQQALADDDFGAADRIDGGHLSWTGTWELAGDTLRVRFDRVLLEVFGDVPIVGKVTVPVTDEPLSTVTEVDYLYELTDLDLILRGAVTLGVDADGQAASLEGVVGGPAAPLAQAAVELLAGALDEVDGQRYIRR